MNKIVIKERRHMMTISYNKLWKLMIDKNINKTKLREEAGISSNAMAKLGKNESVQLEVLAKICKTLDCNIEDVCEILFEEYYKDKVKILNDIKERENIINSYNTFGCLDRENAIHKIQELRIKDSQVGQVTAIKLVQHTIPFEQASDSQIVNELMMQVGILKSELLTNN